MPIIPFIEEKAGEMRAVFEDLHRHPEIGFEEQHASGVVAELLEKWGFDEVHTGIAKTGVVGILRGRNAGNRRVGLRADMDALPIDEISGVPYTSQNPGRMHACGHDGHTTMLLGAAQYLAATRNFEGTAVFVFQPAEEGLGGARGMIAEGLLSAFLVMKSTGCTISHWARLAKRSSARVPLWQAPASSISNLLAKAATQHSPTMPVTFW